MLYPWDGEDRVRAVGHGAREAMAPHLSGVPGDTPVEPVAMHRDYGPLYVGSRELGGVLGQLRPNITQTHTQYHPNPN